MKSLVTRVLIQKFFTYFLIVGGLTWWMGAWYGALVFSAIELWATLFFLEKVEKEF